jgi:flavin reductase (DIM6/NTAB) family NADH-FMN oxidoreductase RutF
MAKQAIQPNEHFAEVMRILGTRGLLLGSYDAKGNGNLMTIGWAAQGLAWGKPIWVVMVRPSRYTYECIEGRGAFTVNVPGAAMAEACRVCGATSGRDTDKFRVCRLTSHRAETVDAPVVAESPLVFECRVVHSNDVLPPRLAEDIRDRMYPGGDFHRVYWGEILATRADANVAAILSE